MSVIDKQIIEGEKITCTNCGGTDMEVFQSTDGNKHIWAVRCSPCSLALCSADHGGVHHFSISKINK